MARKTQDDNIQPPEPIEPDPALAAEVLGDEPMETVSYTKLTPTTISRV